MPEIWFSIRNKNPAYYLSWKPQFGLVRFTQVRTKNWLENSVFGKISRIEWVEGKGEFKVTSQESSKQAENDHWQEYNLE